MIFKSIPVIILGIILTFFSIRFVNPAGITIYNLIPSTFNYMPSKDYSFNGFPFAYVASRTYADCLENISHQTCFALPNYNTPQFSVFFIIIDIILNSIIVLGLIKIFAKLLKFKILKYILVFGFVGCIITFISGSFSNPFYSDISKWGYGFPLIFSTLSKNGSTTEAISFTFKIYNNILANPNGTNIILDIILNGVFAFGFYKIFKYLLKLVDNDSTL